MLIILSLIILNYSFQDFLYNFLSNIWASNLRERGKMTKETWSIIYLVVSNTDTKFVTAHYWLKTQKENPNQNQNVAEHLFWHTEHGGTYIEQLAEEESHL